MIKVLSRLLNLDDDSFLEAKTPIEHKIQSFEYETWLKIMRTQLSKLTVKTEQAYIIIDHKKCISIEMGPQ